MAKTINDKQNKYQELANEISAMWKQNAAQVIPIVISFTGVIPKSLPQSLKRLHLHTNTYIQGGSNMTGTDLCVNKPHKSRSYLNHLVQMQTSVILGTFSIVRNFLNYK